MRRPKKRPFFYKLSKLLISFGVVIFCLLAVWLLFAFFWNIKKAVWKEKGNFNFVVQTEKTYLLSFHPEDDTLNIIILPINLYLETAMGYGEYQLEKISLLGEAQGKNGGEFLAKSIQNFFHLPFDGYIIQVPAKSLDQSSIGLWSRSTSGGKSEEIEKGNILPLLSCLMAHHCQTNLSSWDLIRLFNRFRQLKLTQVRLVELNQYSPMVKKESLADGTQVLRLETLLLDDLGQKYFTDNLFIEEHLKTILINATDYSQLAQKVNTLLTNSGLEVIVAKNKEVQSKSVIEYANPKIAQSDTLKKIKRIPKINQTRLNAQLEGDLEIILGDDFKKNFYLP